jgi:hypothetical protein
MNLHMRRRWVRLLWPALPAALPALWPALGLSMVQAAGSVDVWIDLDLPALALAQTKDPARRMTLRERVLQQQDAVMVQLTALGARELGRVQLARNALAVRLPREQLDAARRLPGVRRVSPVRDRRRLPPVPID